MVKNPLKKIKVSKDKNGSPEKASNEGFDIDEVKMKTPSKIKKSKMNGVISKTPSTEIQTEAKRENGFKAKVKPPQQQQQHHQLPHGAGNLKKRLRDENKFISDVLEFMVFPKVKDGGSDSDSVVLLDLFKLIRLLSLSVLSVLLSVYKRVAF
jgi:hypothetical protein